MLESRKTAGLIRAFSVMILAGFFARTGIDLSHQKLVVAARQTRPDRGEYGGDLAFLRRWHLGPQHPGESNHYFDLWSGEALPVLARIQGLTNNHALFVDSHGRAGCSRQGNGYGFYPNGAMRPPGPALFSLRDLSRVLSPAEIEGIHNVVLAGCNLEGRLQSAEVRRYFPAATNITYMSPGELAFKPMFYQAITLPSLKIQPLFGNPSRTAEGRVVCALVSTPGEDLQEIGAYIADLYLPGARKPFKTVRAGRELLDPACLGAGAGGNTSARPAPARRPFWSRLFFPSQPESVPGQVVHR